MLLFSAKLILEKIHLFHVAYIKKNSKNSGNKRQNKLQKSDSIFTRQKDFKFSNKFSHKGNSATFYFII